MAPALTLLGAGKLGRALRRALGKHRPQAIGLRAMTRRPPAEGALRGRVVVLCVRDDQLHDAARLIATAEPAVVRECSRSSARP